MDQQHRGTADGMCTNRGETEKFLQKEPYNQACGQTTINQGAEVPSVNSIRASQSEYCATTCRCQGNPPMWQR